MDGVSLPCERRIAVIALDGERNFAQMMKEWFGGNSTENPRFEASSSAELSLW